MKLRMAENSLFAVLLRSRWWISLAVACVFVALTQALLPQDLRNIGSLGALPFFVIAGIAFWRQLKAPSPAQVEGLLAAAGSMGWPEFERALQQGFARDGWHVLPTPPGADLALQREGRTVLVAARRWKAARLGEDTVQALQAAMEREHTGGMVVALGEVSPQALRRAKGASIEVVQGAALAKLLHGQVAARAPA